tara:strand:- start:565 stop:792 length:228 start_codon:yes stop_codon:yes gene_type:complete
MLSHVVVGQSLGTSTSTLLTGLENDHFARNILNLALAVVLEHTLLERIRNGLDILAPFVLDYTKGREPSLWINPY